MPRAVLPDLAVILSFLRSGLGWTQAELAEAAGISPSLLNDYEKGRKTLTRKRLERLAAALGLASESLDVALDCLASCRAAAGPLSDAQRQIEVIAARAGRLAAGFARSSLTLLTMEGQALRARQHADFLWSRLAKRTSAERRKLVEHGSRFRTWALVERVARESIEAAPNHPEKSLELAELALTIAERVPGEAAWRLRIQGYAWAHVANGRRIHGNLPGADQAMARAWKLWKAGEPGDPGLLGKAWLPWMDAALRRDQRRLPEALKSLEAALIADPGELRGKILFTKSGIHDSLDQPELSLAALHEAAPWIDPEKEPRLFLSLRYNLLRDLCRLECFEDVASELSDVQNMAEKLGAELDLTRVLWLRGKVAAGLGRGTEAEQAFKQVREVFQRRGIYYDHALVSLDLAVLFLEQGRTAEVKILSNQLVVIFREQEVAREALAALLVFREAAQQDAATAALAKNLTRFLLRSRHNPDLTFEFKEGAEG